MRINITGVFVDDQRKALKFYTEVLGFELKRNIPVGEHHSWLTVVSPQAPDGVELLLEPSEHPAVGPFRTRMFEDGIPLAQFAVGDIRGECARLRELGVVFTQEPLDMGPVITAVFDDTCGNLIQIIEEKTDA